MCCQPPLEKNDIDALWNKNIKLIDTAPKELPSMGVTGGEPTLLGDRFFKLIRHIRKTLPDTEIHILTNGRAFSEKQFAHRLGEIGPKKILLGIPLHSDNQLDHDLIAGAKGAFTDTLMGLYNLARWSFDIELRVVLTKLNYKRLPKLANFIYRNLPFVRYISLMGLEYTGYTIRNADKVWIDPVDMAKPLCEATLFLASAGLDVSIFNLTHCVLPECIWPFAKKSISDWKNRFEPFCDGCALRSECCGLFATSRKQSPNLHPIL
jgi:His-Xaa-Ser system radical SAM maturase HxsC